MARLSSPLYGRLLSDGNVNQEFVKQGWCWGYRKYAPGDTVLEGLENEARADSLMSWHWRAPASLSAAPESLA